MIVSEKDSLADPQAAKKAFEGINTKDKKIITYPESEHYLMQLDGEYQRVELDVYEWLKDRYK